MNIFGLIKGIFKPAVELVDELHTSEEEKLAQKALMLDAYVTAMELGLEHEQEILHAKAKIVEAEAKSEHWLTATWRPMVMLFFTAMVGADSFGWLANPLSDEAWLLLQLGLGGYVVGRSAEKVTKTVVGTLKQKEEA